MQTTLQEDLRINSSTIEIAESIKSLGVHFDQHMTWNNHTDFVAGKLSQIAGLIYSLNFLPRSVKQLIYNSLFMSHLNYCCLVWGTTSATNIKKLYVLQKKAVRAVCNKPYDFPSASLFQELRTLKITNLMEYRLAIAYKKEHKSNISLIQSIAQLNKRKATYTTRFPEYWYTPHSRTNYGKQMLCSRLPRLLNDLLSNEIDILSCSPVDLYNFFSRL